MMERVLTRFIGIMGVYWAGFVAALTTTTCGDFAPEWAFWGVSLLILAVAGVWAGSAILERRSR